MRTQDNNLTQIAAELPGAGDAGDSTVLALIAWRPYGEARIELAGNTRLRAELRTVTTPPEQHRLRWHWPASRFPRHRRRLTHAVFQAQR